jgi:colanic acid biosynthesis glycosyl transferase WcaI
MGQATAAVNSGERAAASRPAASPEAGEGKVDGMKVLITAKVFPPEMPAAAVLTRELAQEIGRHGGQVTVVTGYPHHPGGRLFPGFRKRWVQVEEQNGYRLVRGWHVIHPSPALPVRALIMASKCASFLSSARQAFKPDVVISFEGYPLIGPLTSALIARRNGAKLVSVIYDIYPDIAIELGKVKNPLLIKVLRQVEALTYRWSDRVAVLSESFRQNLINEKGVAPGKIAVVPVWLDAADIVPQPRDNAWRREMDIPPEKFVVLYAGTIGLVSGAEVILEAARRLRSKPDILFLLVGGGYAKDQVENEARQQGLRNIRMLPFQPRERLSELQATADVSLVTLAPERGRTSVPSKVLGYMAAARPIVASVDLDCDTARMIREAGCGLVVAPGEGESIAQAVWHYYESPDQRAGDGLKGREFFLENYEKKRVIGKFLDLLDELMKQRESLS